MINLIIEKKIIKLDKKKLNITKYSHSNLLKYYF